MLGGRRIKSRQVPAMEVIKIILASVIIPGSRRGSRILRILIPSGVQHLEVQRPKKNCAKCGRAHNGKCKQGTNAYFSCGKSGHMVRDCPQNRGKASVNAQLKPNPQGATTAEPPKRNKFYALKGMEEQEKSDDVVTGMLQISQLLFMIYLIQGLRFPL